jgi:CTP synthase
MNKDQLAEVNALDHVFIFVTGGVCSSLGKGVLMSSLGVLLQSGKSTVSVMKCDPYLNVDPGTLSPLVHGEVFVTADGAETDLDLGHYERMLDISLTRESSITSGKIFKAVIDAERRGDYLGNDIQLTPQVTDLLINKFVTFALQQRTTYTLIEIGGVIGDKENDIYLEAIRQLRQQLGEKKVILCHLSLVPYLPWVQEIKTKPTKHSIYALKTAGLSPDFLFLRTDQLLDAPIIEKVASLCTIEQTKVIQVPTVEPIYKLFSMLDEQQIAQKIQEQAGFTAERHDLSSWNRLIATMQKVTEELSIGLVAKYIGGNDPYISVIEAVKIAVNHAGLQPNIVIINAELLQEGHQESWQQLQCVDGIIVPGGFGPRGIEGKILAAQWARTQQIPFLGLCLGMQVMLIEYARHVLGLANATSTEFDPNTTNPVIHFLLEQNTINQLGGTMRLGNYQCSLLAGSKAQNAYKTTEIHERHRHRYEFNNRYKEQFEAAGMVFSGINSEKDLVEIAEIKDHPFMIGTQFHPEFTSRQLRPHPLFTALIESCLQNQLIIERRDDLRVVAGNN